MKIIIAGGGQVGKNLAKQLTDEGHDLTVIDQDQRVLENTVESFDAMGVAGNCASMEVLKSAGVEDADLVIAMTDADEVNLLCCMTAHGLNSKIHTIARIRNPEYTEQIMTMRNVFPLSMTVNPERQTAEEIQHLLKYPGFLRRDAFAKGKAEIVELRIEKGSKLCNIPLMELRGAVKCHVLVCAVLRAGNAIAPRGNFVLQEGDRIFVTGAHGELTKLLKSLDIQTGRVRRVLLCGGGRVSFYLASLLEKTGVDVTILEKRKERCLELAELLPETSIVHGDCSSQTVLESQGIGHFDAVVALTGLDETNMIIALYAGSCGVNHIITKLGRAENNAIADAFSLGSRISPRELSCNDIVRYVRAMENQVGAAVSMHTIADGQVEAMEFLVEASTKNCGVPLKDMKLKNGVLLASIIRGSHTQIPAGDSCFQPGDTVVVVTSGRGVLQSINDIFA